MLSISSTKPISSISSASSRTNSRTSLSLRVLRLMWSIILPGVPTTIGAPVFRAFICLSIECPPTTARALRFMYFPIRLMSSVTCSASSLVGAKIIAWGKRKLGSTACRIGIAKAAVFPVPVCACPIRSCPESKPGIAAF